jgi:hypothetical protein
MTALHHSGACKSWYAAKGLEAGAKPGIEDAFGRTPFDIAAGACAERVLALMEENAPRAGKPREHRPQKNSHAPVCCGMELVRCRGTFGWLPVTYAAQKSVKPDVPLFPGPVWPDRQTKGDCVRAMRLADSEQIKATSRGLK